jgi:restriction endonuclease S subunit
MERVSLKKYIKQVRGVTYKSNQTLEKSTENYLPVLRSNNINEGALNFNKLVYVPANLIKETQLLKKGDILLTASTGSIKVIGKNGAVKKNYSGSFGAFCKVVRPLNTIDSDYLKHFFQTKYYRKNIQSVINGANINNIKNEHLDNLQILLPKLETQKKIAAILDEADKVRQLNKQLIAKYDALTQSLFLEMFGDPVENTGDWEVKRLKDISIKIHSGNTPKGGSQVYVDKGIMFFRSQNVWKYRLELDNVAYIDEETHSGMMKSSLKNGDILMTKTGRINTENSSLGRAAMFEGEDDSANVNGHVYLIRLQKDVINEFVLHILTTNEYREHIRRVCVGGIDKRQLNKDHIENFPIIYPSIELQNKFVQKLKTIKEIKQQAKDSLQKSEDLFNSLLQKAFKGELVKE